MVVSAYSPLLGLGAVKRLSVEHNQWQLHGNMDMSCGLAAEEACTHPGKLESLVLPGWRSTVQTMRPFWDRGSLLFPFDLLRI
jgi:hypothetical protein